MMTTQSAIPVHVLTGFLGSGKTTQLNRSLRSFGDNTAIVVNEFGEIALDQFFIQEHSADTIVLKNGCVCCAIRTDLSATLMDLAALAGARRRAFDRIIIETSGISDPAPIVATLRSDFNLLTRFSVGAIVTTVDATGYMDMQSRSEGLAQVAAADACVVTKRDISRRAEFAAATAWVRSVNPVCEFVNPEGLVTWIGRFEARDPALLTAIKTSDDARQSTNAHSVRSVILTLSGPISWPLLGVWLTAVLFRHGDRVLRTKGIVREDSRGAWIGINGVRRVLYPPQHLEIAAGSGVRACLVMVVEGLEPKQIEQSYREWVTEADSPRVPFSTFEPGPIRAPTLSSQPLN
jgi:G3E family GTPase